ncbi:Uncharacterised protein [Streptococcus pneumoniae]|nr:Uncharacterised protein [Streptococcus pneumoniae]
MIYFNKLNPFKPTKDKQEVLGMRLVVFVILLTVFALILLLKF